MNCTAIKEENIRISRKEYYKLKNKLTKNTENVNIEAKTYRRIFFELPGLEWSGETRYQDNSDVYSIYWEKSPFSQLFLEKYSNRNGIIYEQREPLSKDQYLLIESGNYDWLKESNFQLFRELYLQLFINQLVISDVYEYEVEIVSPKEKTNSIHFSKSIARVDGELFSHNLYKVECLERDELIVTYRKNVTVSDFYTKHLFQFQAQPKLITI